MSFAQRAICTSPPQSQYYGLAPTLAGQQNHNHHFLLIDNYFYKLKNNLIFKCSSCFGVIYTMGVDCFLSS